MVLACILTPLDKLTIFNWTEIVVCIEGPAKKQVPVARYTDFGRRVALGKNNVPYTDFSAVTVE